MADRRARLEALRDVPGDGVEAASSGCAAGGAHRLALQRSQDAALALRRLDAGVGELCVDCSAPLGAERLEAVVTAVRCVRCLSA